MIDARGESIVLVELDALLDTRLPTLGKINPEHAIKASTDPRYFGRIINDFTNICGVGREEFEAAFKERDVEILQASVITEIPFILNELVLKLEREALDTPFLSSVKVEVNIYPYQLDKDDQDAIATAVAARCGTETPVECISMPPQDMTPEFLKARYSGMFIYNFRDWMEAQLKNFEKVKMPRFTVMAPALYHDKIPKPDEFAQDGFNSELTAFQLAEVGSVELYSLTLLPAVNFSMARIPGIFKETPVTEAPAPKITGDLKYHVK